MHFAYDDEQAELARVVRRFLATHASGPDVRAAMASPLGCDPALVQRLAGELGIFSLGIPEDLGGAGYGVVELALVMQEAGRAMLCAPLLAHAFASRVLLECADAAIAKQLLPDAAAGATLLTVAALEPGARWDDEPATAFAGGRLTGQKDWVLDGAAASTLLVTAATADGPSLFAVEGADPQVVVDVLPTGDRTRRVARVTLDGAAGTLVGKPGQASAVIRRALNVTVVLLAAEQLGVAEHCLDAAVAHAKQREQFGRAIGAFQAVKHKLADVLLEVEAARSVSMYAAWAADHRPEELAEVACIAGATCSETALLAAGESIQVHGGMGVTWEHDAHLYLKRALTSRQLFGSPQDQLESLASRIGLDARPAAENEENRGQPIRA